MNPVDAARIVSEMPYPPSGYCARCGIVSCAVVEQDCSVYFYCGTCGVFLLDTEAR